VRVRMPLVDNEKDGTWARLRHWMPVIGAAFSSVRGGDEVVLDSEQRSPPGGDPRMLHSSAKPAPLQGSDDNHEKVYQSRSRMKLYFNDNTKSCASKRPRATRSPERKRQGIKIVDQNGNKIEMTKNASRSKAAKR